MFDLALQAYNQHDILKLDWRIKLFEVIWKYNITIDSESLKREDQEEEIEGETSKGQFTLVLLSQYPDMQASMQTQPSPTCSQRADGYHPNFQTIRRNDRDPMDRGSGWLVGLLCFGLLLPLS